MLGKIFSRQHFEIFFPDNKLWDFMQLAWKLGAYFLGKIRKISICCLACWFCPECGKGLSILNKNDWNFELGIQLWIYFMGHWYRRKTFICQLNMIYDNPYLEPFNALEITLDLNLTLRTLMVICTDNKQVAIYDNPNKILFITLEVLLNWNLTANSQ